MHPELPKIFRKTSQFLKLNFCPKTNCFFEYFLTFFNSFFSDPRATFQPMQGLGQHGRNWPQMRLIGSGSGFRAFSIQCQIKVLKHFFLFISRLYAVLAFENQTFFGSFRLYAVGLGSNCMKCFQKGQLFGGVFFKMF